ncbi:MAG: ChbG/HpnK family deacetylase [Verrucomicrobiota bacterium JB025]|nr:ChbG/HpnK family deacetylase [Verrucomicrobiota bacterium JB025]
MKTIVLCADDYAQSPAVSSGIRSLVRTGRISAVSCFADAPQWPDEARRLAAAVAGGGVSVGLHLNLTHPFRPGRRPLATWIGASLTRQLDVARWVEDFRRQWDAFVREFGRLPDFIDGHQHVHVFPLIRQAVFQLIRGVAAEGSPAVRSLFPLLPGQARGVKTRTLGLLSLGFDPRAEGLRTNPDFGGIHAFKSGVRMEDLFAAWLASASDGSLIMCHPGRRCNDPADPIAAIRWRELEFLTSRGFASLLAAHDLRLGHIAR